MHIGSTGMSGTKGFYTLFANNLSLKWKNTTMTDHMLGSPAVSGGIVYVGNDGYSSYLRAWNARTGAPAWNTTDNHFHGTESGITITDGVLYAGTGNGLYAFGTQHPLTLTAPNGGQIWKRNTPQTIRWQYTGSPGTTVGTTVRIDLMNRTALNLTIAPAAPIGAKGSGTYTWQIPVGQVPGQYTIRITSGGKADVSNEYFTITA